MIISALTLSHVRRYVFDVFVHFLEISTLYPGAYWLFIYVSVILPCEEFSGVDISSENVFSILPKHNLFQRFRLNIFVEYAHIIQNHILMCFKLFRFIQFQI